MKAIIYRPLKMILILFFSFLGLMSCNDDWVNPEQIEVDYPPKGSEAYYANLRSYKNSPHQIAFAWFGASGITELRTSMADRWDGLPDSLDIVSLWGGYPEKGSPAHEKMKFVQEVKGTKLVKVFFDNDPFFNGYSKEENFYETYILNQTEERKREGFQIVADSLWEEVNEFGYDGIDIDHEPGACSCGDYYSVKDGKDFGLFIDVLGQYFGLSAGTGKLLIVDGGVDAVPPEIGYKHLNYAISQAYGTRDPIGFQGRYNPIAEWCPPERFIITENFESYENTPFNDPIRGEIPAFLGYAYWNPMQGSKGGAGAYQIQIGYTFGDGSGHDLFRKMIQIMNPAPRSRTKKTDNTD